MPRKKTKTLLQHLGIKRENFSSDPMFAGPALMRVMGILHGFRDNGGLCRQETVGAFEEQHGYIPGVTSNACYNSAIGVLVSGYSQTNPGMHVDIPPGADNPIYQFDMDANYAEGELDETDMHRFALSLEENLAKDKIYPDIDLRDVDKYFPVIKFHGRGDFHPFHNSTYDYHFVVPHMDSDEITFSCRPSYQSVPEEYDSLINLLHRSSFCLQNLYTADVYFVPNDWMGTRIHVTSDNDMPASSLGDIFFLDMSIEDGEEVPAVIRYFLDNMPPFEGWSSSPGMDNEPA